MIWKRLTPVHSVNESQENKLRHHLYSVHQNPVEKHLSYWKDKEVLNKMEVD